MFFSRKKRVLLIGLDCATPELLFSEYLDKLPNIKQMVEGGIAGNLHSSFPPITIPAWMVMHSGKTPGQLGLYGFRHRTPGNYQDYWIATSNKMKKKKIWDYLGEKKRISTAVGIPPSYPVYPIKGNLISGFITPDSDKEYTYPPKLKNEIQNLIGDYPFDVVFRTDNRDNLLDHLYDMTDKHFKVIEYLLHKKKWHYFSFIEIGLDRLHHAFWKFFDKEHHLYPGENKYENVAEEYYKYLDRKVGRILNIIPNNTTVITVSDHGAKRMKGCFCVNEWLIKEGLLSLEEYPKEQKRFSKLDVDWENTKAWGWGGYYARIFINKKGREIKGTVSKSEYEDFREELIQKIKSIKGPQGEDWNTVVHKPEEFYDDPQGEYPDLMVYFDNLYYRSAGSVGRNSLFLSENDTGPDDAVHDWNGIFIMYNTAGTLPAGRQGSKLKGQGKKTNSDIGCRTNDIGGTSKSSIQNPESSIQNYSILDIAPTVLDKFGLEPEKPYKGKVIGKD